MVPWILEHLTFYRTFSITDALTFYSISRCDWGHFPMEMKVKPVQVLKALILNCDWFCHINSKGFMFLRFNSPATIMDRISSIV